MWAFASLGTKGEELYDRPWASERCELLYWGVLPDDKRLVSESDCLRRWCAELMSVKESLNALCLGVTGDGFSEGRADCAPPEPSREVAMGGRSSREAVREVSSRVMCCAR